MIRMRRRLVALSAVVAALHPAAAAAAAGKREKAEAVAAVAAQTKQVQVMVDQVFSFAEPGFQEVRTSAYLADILEKNGFAVTRGVAGIPTAFTATWGTGGPLIALGSDIDDLLGVSQTPGVPTIKPLIAGAPGHGEGHNAGLPMMIAAAIAAKQVMERHHIPGRLMIWPGVAEELLGAKAYYVRAGMFRGVDACIFAHVNTGFGTGYGDLGLNGMVSVEYSFHGKTAHAAAMPWEGRSALDAAEIMDVAWNFRREHLPVSQRSHDVVSNGGGQPNVVPDAASTWYYFRDHDFAAVRALYETGNEIAEAAAQATGTTVTRQLLGYAAPNWGNKPLAEVAWANIKAVGMPKWTAADQAFARSVQVANHFKVEPLATWVQPLSTPETRKAVPSLGASDDIGDVMWTVPTITVGFPSNVPNVIFHHATAAMAMATPIAHKGAVAGAEAVAMTVLDLMTTPRILADAKAYQTDVQFKADRYDPVLTDADHPAIHRNEEVMRRLRPSMEQYYYDPSRYASYLEQLGVTYQDAAPSADARAPDHRP